MTQTITVAPSGAGNRGHQVRTVACPPDKSITHRAFMFAGMAKGVSRIDGPLLGADCRSTMGALTAMGVEFIPLSGGSGEGSAYEVHSPGIAGWQSPLIPLDFGNSGTTARLMTGILAGTPGIFATCFGDASLSSRPMRRVVDPLRQAGADIRGRDGGNLMPLAITGTTLRPMQHTYDKASAQVKSALILSGISLPGETSVTLPAGGRDHTEKMLAAMGANIEVTRKGLLETITLNGPFAPVPGHYRIPGDPSSAAFLLALGLISPGLEITVQNVLVNPTRTGFMTLIERMQGDVRVATPRQPAGYPEPIADVIVRGGRTLTSFDMEPDLAPTLIDEVPVLACVALFAKGTSRFRGVGELRVKESDRLQATLNLIAAAGGRARAEGDDLIVEGRPDFRPCGFSFDPDWDHRLAMAAAVLGRAGSAPVTISGPECVDVSFPGFFDVLQAI